MQRLLSNEYGDGVFMKKRIIIIILLIILIIIGGVGYFVYDDMKQEAILKQEIVKLNNKDLGSDNYDIKIKTKGDYAYIEEAIKKYYKELSDDVKVIDHYLDDDDLANILSGDNLESDRPEFKKSYKLIDDASLKVVEAMESISELCDEKKIKSLVDSEKLDDDYYLDLYKELMYSKKDLQELKQIKSDMKKLAVDLDKFLSKEREIIDYLKVNNASLEIEKGEVYFSDDNKVTGYNKLIDELQDIANSDSFKNSNSKDSKNVGSGA